VASSLQTLNKENHVQPNEKCVCGRLGITAQVPTAGSKLGLALSTLGRFPVHGARLQPANGTNGWYIWCGDQWSEEADFYDPLHVEHIPEYLRLVQKYLSLPPGYKFIIDDQGYEDMWFDEELLGP
jgi:hypothetical protein